MFDPSQTADPPEHTQESPPSRPIRNFLKHFAGLGFFGGSLAMIGIDEYALAGVLLLLSGIAFWIQIHEWKIFSQNRRFAKIVKGLLYLSVVVAVCFFATVFVKHKADKPLSNLLIKDQQPEIRLGPDQTKREPPTLTPTPAPAFVSATPATSVADKKPRSKKPKTPEQREKERIQEEQKRILRALENNNS